MESNDSGEWKANYINLGLSYTKWENHSPSAFHLQTEKIKQLIILWKKISYKYIHEMKIKACLVFLSEVH